jgi:isoleucyl-tRNA synthetase
LFENIIKEELNVKEVEWANSSNDFIEHKLKLNFRHAGPKLGRNVQAVHKKITNASTQEINDFLNNGNFTVLLDNQESVSLTFDDIDVQKTVSHKGFAEANNKNFTVILDTTITENLAREGMVRDLIRAVQDMRKQKNLPVEQRIDLYLSGSDDFIASIQNFQMLIYNGVILKDIHLKKSAQMDKILIGDEEVWIEIK